MVNGRVKNIQMIEDYLREKRKLIDEQLNKYLPAEEESPELIHKAMRYSVFAGGKRFRPILLLATGKTLGVNEEDLLEAACAIECIHTYSLIHDDLPCIDNDDYRRGKLTNHKVFGEAIAVLAGDALLTVAFQILSRSKIAKENPHIGIRVIECISDAIGTEGMLGGQVFDITYEKVQVSSNEIIKMDFMKTARLIRASVMVGAIISEVGMDIEKILSAYGENIGISFQIIDDLFDVRGNAAELGKAVGKDGLMHKATLCSLLGYEAAKQKAVDLINEGIQFIKELDKFNLLTQLAQYLISRLS